MTLLQAALMEADRQVGQQGAIWDTLRRFVAQLNRIGASYAVVGGIALQRFGIQRSTQDVDVLVSQDDLTKLHEQLIGHGYFPKQPGSRHLRDDIPRVRIKFLVSGEFPGDGLPKPVRFPLPQDVAELSEDGIAFVNLKNLIELKLASAKSAAHRIKDRSDVLELIHHLNLTASFADQLDPYVQEEFAALVALPPPSERD
jgi:hypothetical protein